MYSRNRKRSYKLSKKKKVNLKRGKRSQKGCGRVNKKKNFSKKAKVNSKLGRGLFGLTGNFYEDNTANSCNIPVKDCRNDPREHEIGECRKFFYYDEKNKLYRPCRNPDNKNDTCRPTAKKFNYKCKENNNDEYRQKMEDLERAKEKEKKQNELDKQLRKQIGKASRYSVMGMSAPLLLQRKDKIVFQFGHGLIEDHPEVNFSKFMNDNESQIRSAVKSKIEDEIEKNKDLVEGDIDLNILYKILEDVRTIEGLNELLYSKFNHKGGIDRNEEFLKTYGIPKVIQKIKFRQEQDAIRRQQERKAREKSKKMEDLYKEIDDLKPYSPQGTLGEKKVTSGNSPVKEVESVKYSSPKSASSVESQKAIPAYF